MVKKVSIIIPCYNEEKNISYLSAKIQESINSNYLFEVIFVDDGSTDNTLLFLKEMSILKPDLFKYISLSRNFGHQNALYAGICKANGDCIVMMDADLQHPPGLIIEMISKWESGYDIVYTIRELDPKLPFIKKTTSRLYYLLLNSFSDVKVENGAADFRLIDKSVAKVLKEDINEGFLFLRGIFNWVGFKKCSILYKPESRFLGSSKYSIKKMLSLAANGIFSFSIKPLRVSAIFGLIITCFAFIYGLFAIYMKIFTEKTISGWTSVLISVLFMGGMIMMILGIIGEYIGRIYVEVKRRPRFIIKETNYEE